MENFYRALFPKEWKHGISLGLERRFNIRVSETIASVWGLRASNTTLIVILVNRIEVNGFVHQGCRHRLLIDVFCLKDFLGIGAHVRTWTASLTSLELRLRLNRKHLLLACARDKLVIHIC